MKKIIKIFCLVGLIFPAIVNGQLPFYIKGVVYEAGTSTPVRGAKVLLKNAKDNSALNNTKTGSKGEFVFNFRKLNDFIVEVSMSGYKTYTTPIFFFGELMDTYNLDKIYLQKSGSNIDIPPTKVDTLPPEKVLEKKFRTYEILPTRGAYELFYLLNPELSHKALIPDNYEIKLPKFPDFSDSRENFNQKFKKDKRKREPYISSAGFNDREGIAYPTDNIKSLFRFISPTPMAFSIKNSIDDHFQNFLHGDEGNTLLINDPNGKPKKFVFVIWKTLRNGEPVTDGDDVVKKFRVYYYQPIKQGDTSSYNRASDATYGYAPMEDTRYRIEVYNQDTGKRVKTSDDEVDPHEFFLRHDIWVAWNISYIKILIRVYD